MKTIVDSDTGEIVEVEETKELVIRELNEVGVDFENYFEKEIQCKALIEQLEMWKTKNREPIQQIFEKYNIKSLKTDSGSISYVPEGKQKRIDTERMKQDGSYEKYLKLVPTKAHLMIKAKEK